MRLGARGGARALGRGHGQAPPGRLLVAQHPLRPVATDADGDRGTLEFALAVGTELTYAGVAAPALAFRTGYVVNVVLPAAAGGDGMVTYALGGPALPRGLRFVAARPNPRAEQTPTLFGTPTEAHARATYTLTATDRDRDPELHRRSHREPHPGVRLHDRPRAATRSVGR